MISPQNHRELSSGNKLVAQKLTNLKKSVLNITDLRELARKRLTKALFDFCDKGSEDQVNLRANRTALDNIKLMPRMLRDVSKRHPCIKLFGKEHALPLIIGPTGPAGEAGATRALEILDEEIRRTMAVMGINNISEISRYHIRLPAELPVSGHFHHRPK